MSSELIAWAILGIWALIPLYMAYLELAPWRNPQLESSKHVLEEYAK